MRPTPPKTSCARACSPPSSAGTPPAPDPAPPPSRAYPTPPLHPIPGRKCRRPGGTRSPARARAARLARVLLHFRRTTHDARRTTHDARRATGDGRRRAPA
ncbi:MAG: hypothetical protein DI534_08855 [Leifsonia xyli]|nr:MAG: hypothetical protein DI534_08855 [Leifsonia xyli]